ncbi:XdhC family protein [Chitinophagaceae bacterium MMS25-I14]
MKEIQDVIQAFEDACKTGKRTALATVVHVEGSSYRRPGARMLVTEDGVMTGAISGGCLEGDALRKALLAITEQRNKLVTYDTTDEDDAVIGVQLGCNGIVHILFEPLNAQEENHPLALLKQVVSGRKDAVLVTLFALKQQDAAQPGTCLFTTGEIQLSNLWDMDYSLVYEEVALAAAKALQERASAIKTFGSFTGFVAFIPPAIALVVAGAGNDVIPLAIIAAGLGWQVTVADGRSTHATARRFPQASVKVALPEALAEVANMDTRTAFVLMTHNYNYDLAALKALLVHDCAYIGVLGPKQKLERMYHDMEAAGFYPDEERKECVHGPVGLDIGAETAEEIAISIVAEIQAVFSGGNGKELKNKQEPIHSNKQSVHG